MLLFLAQVSQLEAVNVTVAGILLGGLTVCGYVIRTLYSQSEARFSKVENKLDECEKDRVRLWEQQATNYNAIMKVLAEMSTNRQG